MAVFVSATSTQFPPVSDRLLFRHSKGTAATSTQLPPF
jgi:hypothetical protein